MFIEENLKKYDVLTRYTFDSFGPTPVINTRMPDELRVRIIKEIDWMSEMQALILEYIRSLGEEAQVGYYNPYSLEFDNAILFSPAGFEWYQLNKDIVETVMPDLGGVVLNALAVPAGKHAYGVHNSRPWAAGFRQMCDGKEVMCLFSHRQNSLHAALEDVTYGHQPLIIYEGAEPEVPSQPFQVYIRCNSCSRYVTKFVRCLFYFHFCCALRVKC